jgi:putative oxidoreductase
MSAIVSTTSAYNPTMPLVGRSLMALIFLVAGVRKALAFAGTAGYFAKLGFPLPEVMVVVAIAIEIGASLALLVGWRTRWAAWLLALFVLVGTLMAHRFWELDAAQYANQMNHFLKNVAIIGGLCFIATFGPGSASLDKS